MNPYPERMEELHAWLDTRFGQRDRQATEILLAAILASSDPAPLRVIIETDWPQVDTSLAWFTFGGLARCRTLEDLRASRPRYRERMTTEWLADGEFLFVEPAWRALQKRFARDIATTGTFYANCVRLRVESPKGGQGLQTIEQRRGDRQELNRLARRALDPMLRSALASRNVAARSTDKTPESLLFWLELTARIAPGQADFDCLTGSIAGVARGIAGLYHDGRDADWTAAERVMRDCIADMTTRIIEDRAGDSQDRPERAEYKRLLRLDVLQQRRRRKKGAPPLISVKGVKPGPSPGLAKHWRDLLDRNKRILV